MKCMIRKPIDVYTLANFLWRVCLASIVNCLLVFSFLLRVLVQPTMFP